ncbi:hypothetical protein MPNTM1_03937 [Mycolicibacterium parafortuitum]
MREAELRSEQRNFGIHSRRKRGRIGSRRRTVYLTVGLFMLLYMASAVAFAVMYEPNLQFFSYYVVNYDDGFIRRGLGGEIVDLFPADSYFTGLLVLRWLIPGLFCAAIAAVGWTVAVRFGRSERRLMLALLLPMLPFGLLRAVVVPTPDLLGATALAVFALALATPKRDRWLLVASGVYGVATAVLALIHEAIPFLQALGAILAIVVLVKSKAKMQYLSAGLAVAPGLIVALAVASLGHRDASSHCVRLPHRAVEFPILLSPRQVLDGEKAYTDFHEWTCRYITVTTGETPVVGPGQVGWTPWIGSTLTGLAVVVVSTLVIRTISHVPFAQFFRASRGRLPLVTTATLLLLPVFVTSSDWSRWWVAIAFDMGVVYLLFASNRTESAKPATTGTRVFFAVALVVSALFPAAVAIMATEALPPLIAQCDQLATDPMWVGICP